MLKLLTNLLPTGKSKSKSEANKVIKRIGAASAYRARKDIHPGRTSSLKKMRRADDIATGKRPISCIPDPVKIAGREFSYHPTKGIRNRAA
ncbi:hypothetical protein [Roseibium aggregatum]|uniref:Uncharacterized protein n=1 Tax=Roseibium aggregatum TaxID=187304 RepID=A0A0M6Y6L7_9HYPH|nr:hypothetical protein [Roseibium aggregatum]CTQ45745.1 hypothetical protein LAL4801_04200 [Roseibium aggregatum]